MSSRALRKAQKEREEQEQLEKLRGEQQDEDDEEPEPLPATRKSAFAMLDEPEEGDEDEIEGEDEGGVALAQDEPSQALPTPQKASSKKKKKKNKKAKGAGNKSVESKEVSEKEESLDEIDAALKQLSTSAGAGSGTTAAGEDANSNEASRLLAIDSSHLHAQNEMRRLFGRAALEQDDDGGGGDGHAGAGGNRRQQRRGQQMGLAQALRGQRGQGGRSGGLAALGLRRNIFIQGKEEWPVATGGGLGMEVVEKRGNGTVEYKFVHNRGYQDVQSQFESCVASMDPNRLVVLLQHNPYHISTLLQVSEIAKSERDHTTSGDLLERALFSFGRAVHSTFAKHLADGKARLDFRRPENREFWLASERYMQNLSMRATWRTVYEWAKLLLSLSPNEDPYAIWLSLDQYAIRCQQSLDYLNISRNATFKKVHDGMPNVQLSQALAECRAGNKSKGQQALYTAVGRYPWVVNRLMQELSIQPPPGVWGKEPRTDREKLHAELYATQAKDLWNTPEMSALLTEIASAVPADTPSADPDTAEIQLNEARLVLISDIPALIALIPREYTARLTSSSDPLPPTDNIASYETAALQERDPNAPRGIRSNEETIHELQGLHGFFANLFPWFTPTGDGAGEERPQPSQEEIERLVEESGVDRDVIAERSQRMIELQRHLIYFRDQHNAHFPEDIEDDDADDAQVHDRQARVEDGDDDEN